MNNTITITRPDDWHIHMRNAEMLRAVVNHTARCFARALIMPNLMPPVTDAKQAMVYRDEILGSVTSEMEFNPLMTLYLTDNTSVKIVRQAADCPHVVGFKLYPAGATTNSDSGVTGISKIMPILESMAANNLILQVHGEVTDPHIDIFDREAEFIDQVLAPLHRELPELKIVFEHITSREAAEFVTSSSSTIGATITPQHLMFSRNDIFDGGIRPHFYCLPILKRHQHRLALLAAATSGNPSFFLGTDSAPHLKDKKENHCGCAGIYSAHAAIELYAEVFEAMDAMDRLEAFASFHGADFYGVPRNTGEITLARQDWQVPSFYAVKSTDPNPEMSQLIPMQAGQTIRWQLVS